MSDFTLVRLLPSAGALDANTPALVQWSTGAPVESTTLAALGGSEASARPIQLVLSCADAVMTRVTLSRKQARHLQKVLPYLLEETLIGDPESFWFSTGEPEKVGRDEASWPVLAVRKDRLRALRDWFAEQDLPLRGVTADASLLAARAPLRLADSAGVLLVPDAARALTVDADSEETVCRAMEFDTGSWNRIEGDEAAFRAFREAFDEGAPVEMLHGALRPPRHRRDAGAGDTLGPWRPLATLAAAVILVVCVLLGLQQWRYQRAAEDTRQQAAALYQQLFPGDRASSGLRRQFQARLNRLGGGGGEQGFLAVMAPVGEVLAGFREQGVRSKRLRYDAGQGALTVDLEADGFEVLEKVRGAINDKGLSAEIATARNEGEGVKARLKVERG